MTLHPSLNSALVALVVLLIVAVGVWIVLAIVDERKLRIIICVVWVVLVILASFGLLR